MKITAAVIESLQILAEHGPLLPGRFADYRWPNAVRKRAGGNCQHRGGDNMAICAGGWLAKLRGAGLAYLEKGVTGTAISGEGLAILQASTEATK